MPGSFMNKEAGAYDLGDLDQALFQYLRAQEHSPPLIQEQIQTLNIFPSQPMHVHHHHDVEPSTKGGVLSTGSSASNVSKASLLEQPMDLRNPARTSSLPNPGKDVKLTVLKKEGARKLATSSSDLEGTKTPDAKILRRLAQNREAARKSRLRKKAYIQQLESSRIKLSQLEQELQRARTQGVFFGGGVLGEQGLAGGIGAGISSEAAMFDMEYGRWLEEHHRLMCELRAAVQERLPEAQLKMFVDSCLAHFDELMGLRAIAAKTDVFHLVSGMWMTPAERCFMWMGGFRPSDLIKVLLSHMEPLSEQQILGIYGLRTSTHETEDALTQGLEALHQSLSDTIASGDLISCPASNMADYMGQMAVAMNKLSTLEGFVRQADNLRQQTLHRLHQILSTRQAAGCFLAIAEHLHRLRALSSLWLARPRLQEY